MIREITFEEIDFVSGGGEIGDAIRAIGESLEKIGDAAYDAGHRLGKAIHDAINK